MPSRSVSTHKNNRRMHHTGENGVARPIRTKRDYVRASAVVEKLKLEVERESAAETRLQSLLQELERYDPMDEYDYEAASDFSLDDEYDGPMRRWSDDPNDLD